MHVCICIYVGVCVCVYICVCVSVRIRAETNTQFARLHNYSNTLKVFGYTKNDFGVIILVYLVNIYIFKAISVIQ